MYLLVHNPLKIYAVPFNYLNYQRYKYIELEDYFDKFSIKKSITLEKALQIGYAQENPIELSHTPIKSTNEFKENYKYHDLALDEIVRFYNCEGYEVYNLGCDSRERKVQITNEAPDLLIVESESPVFAIDAKSKGSLDYFGWVNQRAVKGYRAYAQTTGLPVYAAFVYKFDHTIKGHSDIRQEPLETTLAWDRNTVFIFPWEYGLPKIV